MDARWSRPGCLLFWPGWVCTRHLQKEQIAIRNWWYCHLMRKMNRIWRFLPINPCCKSLFDRRVQVNYASNVISPNTRTHARTRPTVCQQRPPSVKHQAPVNIYIAPPPPSAVLLAKYVFTWEINRGKWNYTRSIVKVSYCITWV